MCSYFMELVYMLHIFWLCYFNNDQHLPFGLFFCNANLCILFCMNSCVHKYDMGLFIKLYNFRSSRNLTTSLVNMSNNGPQSNQRLGFHTQLTLDTSVFLDQRFVRTLYFCHHFSWGFFMRWYYPLYLFTLLEWNENYIV